MLLQSQSRYYENVFRLVGRFRFAARPQILPADELRGAERARHRGFSFTTTPERGSLQQQKSSPALTETLMRASTAHLPTCAVTEVCYQ